MTHSRPLRFAWPVCLLLLGALCASGQKSGDYHGRQAWRLENQKVEVVVLPGGGHIASIALRTGPGAGVNPLWLPPWQSVEPEKWNAVRGRFGDAPGAPLLASIMGHSICFDYFGSPSDAEAKAGLPVHGEAPTLRWTADVVAPDHLVYTATLPKAHMKISREIALTPNSSAIWITETATNLTALDRPYSWNQHVSLGAPFLREGESYYDMNGTWSSVDLHSFSTGQRLKQAAEFVWPHAPGSHGGDVDLRAFPGPDKSSDFTVSEVDPASKWGWFTAVNVKSKVVIGYIWPRKDWPWAANWEENRFRTGKPWSGKAIARGIEFGTTPFAYSRRETVEMGKLHGVPTYAWMPANGHTTVSYASFIAPVPAGTTGVRNVELQAHAVRISLNGSNTAIILPLKR